MALRIAEFIWIMGLRLVTLQYQTGPGGPPTGGFDRGRRTHRAWFGCTEGAARPTNIARS